MMISNFGGSTFIPSSANKCPRLCCASFCNSLVR
uniref:Uncharacterized protein n=1 Tax=Glossina morsitans morsitans TaxID=37546 RepID=A0A905AWC0_GLOMM